MSKPTCYPKTALQQYVAGWTDAEASSVIEAHISECDICEQTLAELESDPETLLEFLHGQINATETPPPGSIPSDPLVSYALSKAKRLGQDQQVDAREADHAPAPPPASLGPYELLRPIGQGSMGRVYLARHRQLGKLVAVKIFASRAFRSHEYARRFEREVRAAGALQHPAIINATDAGQSKDGQADSVHYLVMEYIEGQDLSRLVRAVGPLSIADACAIGQAMALGLDHAHAAGIVHRDIKPSNVMLSTNGQVKLLDFGLAQMTVWDEATAELTTVGQLMGTIDYMAPEQAERAESVDYRADLYALGATLFRLLCGRAPLAASPNLSPLARLRLLATSSPPALRTLRADAPVELEKLIHQLLSRDPDARPASAAHVAEQLALLAKDANLPALIRSALQSTPTMNDESMAAAAVQPTVASRLIQPPKRVSRWLIAAASGAMALAAIVLITLETQKGQVVIESLDANVTVQLSKDGQVQKSLTVVPGANTTRIAAGQYDVSIAAGSDQFAMDRQTLEIKRGETVIARVRQLPTPPFSTTNTDVTPSASTVVVNSDGNVYEGKSLATWRAELIRDRSLEAIVRALGAIGALATEQERPAILQEFMQNFPTHIDEKNQLEVMGKIKAVAGDTQIFTQCVVAALSKVDDKVARQLLNRGPLVLYRLRQTDRQAWLSSLASFTQWSANFLQAERQRAEAETLVPLTRAQLREEAGLCILTYLQVLRSETPRQLQRERMFVDLLTRSQVLDEHFWLRLIPNTEEPFVEALAAAIEERATATFLESNDPAKVSVATLQLIRFNNGVYDRSGMPPLKKRAEIIERIRGRIHEFIEHPKNLVQYVRIDDELYTLLYRPQITPKLTKSFATRLGDTQTNPSLDLLQLAAKLQAYGELAEELKGLFAKTKEPSIRLATQLLGNCGNEIALNLPVLTPTTIRFASNLSLSNTFQEVRLTPEEISSALVFSQIEGMLPKQEQAALVKELREAIKQGWLDQQMQIYDFDANGKIDVNELPNPRAADLDGDQSINREELQAHYDQVIDGIELRR